MKAFVIMRNDYPEGVCLGNEETAKAETDKLRTQYFEQTCRHTMSMDEYKMRCFWTPREVDIVGPVQLRARFTHFKEGGKWYASGIGLIPADLHLVGRDQWRALIAAVNGGALPGLSGDGAEFFTSVVPIDPDGSDGVPALLAPG